MKKIGWFPKLLKVPNFKFKPCLFGEHLLKTNDKKPVAIAEKPETQVFYILNILGLACDHSSSLSKDRTKVISKSVGMDKNVTTYYGRHSAATIMKKWGANI